MLPVGRTWKYLDTLTVYVYVYRNTVRAETSEANEGRRNVESRPRRRGHRFLIPPDARRAGSLRSPGPDRTPTVRGLLAIRKIRDGASRSITGPAKRWALVILASPGRGAQRGQRSTYHPRPLLPYTRGGWRPRGSSSEITYFYKESSRSAEARRLLIKCTMSRTASCERSVWRLRR